MDSLGTSRRRLDGKVVAITGGGSDPTEGTSVGMAISRLFAHEGARVAVIDLVEERSRSTVDLIDLDGSGEALAVAADVTDAAACEHAISLAVERFGRLDGLVNNVAISSRSTVKGVAETLESNWDRMIEVNLKSAFLMCHCGIPAMAQSGGGSIVFISSIAAERGYGSCAYSVSKIAMIALARENTVVYGSRGIRSNVIEPGSINTPHSYHQVVPEPSEQEIAAYYEARARNVPLATEGTAWDVARAALFFVSDESRWISGAVLPVDGGLLSSGLHVK